MMYLGCVYARAHRAVVGALAVVLHAGGVMAAPSFYAIPILPGNTTSEAVAMSADGSTVVGVTGQSFAMVNGFRWSPMTGISALESPNGGLVIRPNAVNADGTVIVGSSSAGAFRWTSQGGMSLLGVPPGGSLADARGVSADGSVVVGYDSTLNRGFRWTAETGMQLTPNYNDLSFGNREYSEAVSPDGTIIVGRAAGDTLGGVMKATVLTPEGRFYARQRSFATAIGDSLTVTGYKDIGSGTSLSGYTVAFRWNPFTNQYQDLPGVSTLVRYSRGWDINDDGSVVVGELFSSPQSTRQAMMWTSELGTVDLNAYLPTLGIDLSGWILTKTSGVSADGRVLTGIGTFNGVQRAWYVAGVPTPGAAVTLVFGALAASRRRRSR